jgi:hypothetical protein
MAKAVPRMKMMNHRLRTRKINNVRARKRPATLDLLVTYLSGSLGSSCWGNGKITKIMEVRITAKIIEMMIIITKKTTKPKIISLAVGHGYILLFLPEKEDFLFVVGSDISSYARRKRKKKEKK